MKILCLGGGPASLYFSILMKKQNPRHDITVIERGGRDSTWGFGVVFSDETLQGFMVADSQSYQRIVAEFVYWDGIDTTINGQTIHSDGHGFCGMSRLKLLNILHDRCDDLGVNLRFNTDITDLSRLDTDGYDLVVAGDGLTSLIRTNYEEKFNTTIDWRQNRFCWLATTRPLPDFNFIFRENEHGWWWAHAYGYEAGMSTWIVECSNETFDKSGLDELDEAATKKYCEEIFKADLDGHPLITNRSVWRTFPVVRNEKLFYRNMVLIGDAVRSAHFSIGSGTKLAMEDAIALADCIANTDAVGSALQRYQVTRKEDADRLQRTAVTSLSWFEHIDRYATAQEPEQFVFNMICRSKRVTYDNLKLRDRRYIESLDRWFAKHTRDSTGIQDIRIENPVVPVFQPFNIGSMKVENRFQLSAMCQYCAEDGVPDDWHLVHYGSRATGGAGLLNTEMLCIAPEARITPGCAGIWSNDQTEKWRQIVDFIHTHSRAKVCAQIGHAGRKGATCIPWDGGIDQPLQDDAWDLIAPSPLPYLQHSRVPREMTEADMEKVIQDFVRAVQNAQTAGFDMIEIHLAHGYLLSEFISPCTNHRTDEYGGTIENRMRFPQRVLDAVMAAWPDDKPVSARISATDWVAGGTSEEDMLAVATMLKTAGVDIINVSTGQVTKDEAPIYGRMFQVPFSDQIRNEVGIPTIVAGNFTSADQANTVIAAGRCDMVALGRSIMNEPHFVLSAAAHYGHTDQHWAPQYLSGKFSAEMQAQKDNAEVFELRMAARPPNPTETLAIGKVRDEMLQQD